MLFGAMPTMQNIKAVFVVAAIVMTGAWGALPGRSYQVQFRTDFNHVSWTDLGDPINVR